MSLKARFSLALFTLGITLVAWAVGITPDLTHRGFALYLAILVVLCLVYICRIGEQTLSKLLILLLVTTLALVGAVGALAAWLPQGGGAAAVAPRADYQPEIFLINDAGTPEDGRHGGIDA